MSIHFQQGKLQGQERRQVLQAVQQQAKATALEAIKPVLSTFLEAEVTAKLGREKGQPRRVSSQQRLIDWHCGHCGCQDANQFIRDGHYRRGLATSWGYLENLPVPMLECQNCQLDVVAQFTILEKFAGFWFDLDQEVLFGIRLAQCLRELGERLSATLDSSVGLRSLNERINQIEPLLEQAHQKPITNVPAVVQFDGIWLTIQSQNETIKPDKRGRQRHQRSGKQMVVLVALGFWNDGSNRREVLDWEIADSEEHTHWERLLTRLWQRGLRPENGLQMVVRDGGGGLGEAVALVYGGQVIEQRCLFHKLRNVADKARSEFKGKEQQEEKQAFLQQVRAIYDAESAEQAKERLRACVETWQKRAPESVATLERDFEQTIAYYQRPELARHWVRTTSLLERTNRQLRHKFRQAGSFGSQKGAQVAIYLQVQRLHARWSKQSWWQACCSLSLDWRILDP